VKDPRYRSTRAQVRLRRNNFQQLTHKAATVYAVDIVNCVGTGALRTWVVDGRERKAVSLRDCWPITHNHCVLDVVIDGQRYAAPRNRLFAE